MTLTDAVRAALPKIKAMGREEIAKTHAAGRSALVSDGRGQLAWLHPDGSRSRHDDMKPSPDFIP